MTPLWLQMTPDDLFNDFCVYFFCLKCSFLKITQNLFDHYFDNQPDFYQTPRFSSKFVISQRIHIFSKIHFLTMSDSKNHNFDQKSHFSLEPLL